MRRHVAPGPSQRLPQSSRFAASPTFYKKKYPFEDISPLNRKTLFNYTRFYKLPATGRYQKLINAEINEIYIGLGLNLALKPV